MVDGGVYLGLGSNLGRRADNLRQALAAIDRLHGTHLLRVSSWYETAPWGVTDQPRFVNLVAEVATNLGPRELLDCLLAVEASLGRRRLRPWGPRTVDLDLLLYGDLATNEPNLVLPHPGLHQRAFVLLPLADLAPKLQLPFPPGGSVEGWLAALPVAEKTAPMVLPYGDDGAKI